MSSPGVIVGITGATGAIYGVRLLEWLRRCEVPSHLILTPWGKRTVEHEMALPVKEVEALATTVEHYGDLGSAVSSGSFATLGMAIAPCSMKTVAAVNAGFGDNLVTRAADVVLKERRRLVLVVRETPLSEIHLRNMLELARMGAVVMPPVPAFYNHPESIDQMVDYTVARILDQFSIPAPWAERWDGKLRRDGGDRTDPS